MRWFLKRLTYANVTATLALFFALSGGAYAAVVLAPNSVGRTQLQDNAVNSPKVADGSLLAKDFKKGQLPARARGPAGRRGPAGPQGPAGPAGGLAGLQVVYADSGPGPAGTKSAEAKCPNGKLVTGGGALISGNVNASITTSTPGAVPHPTSWYVEARDILPSTPAADWTLYAYAVCATAAP